ncbi:MAG: hypothetical protein JRF33_02325 [Deltaproteobacteria bacterium]|nr:hypothetical protein [Deltaproteobacteria bacterium]
MSWGKMFMLALVGLALTGMTQAAEPAKGKPAIVKPEQEAVQIKSDELKILQKQQKAIFSGNVVATQGELTIRCARLEVRYAETEEGKASGRIKRMLFSGSVDIFQGSRRGHCRQADYDRPARRILCQGKPWVQDGPNRIKGELIIFHLDRDEVEVKRPRAEIEVPKEARPGKKGRP